MAYIDESEMQKLLIALREDGAAQNLEGHILFNTNGPPNWPIRKVVFDEAVKLGYIISEPFTADVAGQTVDMLKLTLTEKGKGFLRGVDAV